MSTGLSCIEHSFKNIHIMYIKGNSVIVRENGISDSVYLVQLADSNHSFQSEFAMNMNLIDSDDEGVSHNFDVQCLLNITPLEADRHLIETFCRVILEELKQRDPSLTRLLIHVPSRLFSNLPHEQKLDKLMEILYNLKNITS